MPLTVKSLDLLPPGQCVVVSNHVSYLDGLVFTAALPPQFGFVIKREMSSVPGIGLFLRRLGSEFVERFDRHRSASDARRVLRTAISGRSLVFFPEGTFTTTPGLLKFHSGAFMTAARARCPVVPATVKGSRVTFPPTSHWPHPGRIIVELYPPLVAASEKSDAAAVELRERAREVILGKLGEPDLHVPPVLAPDFVQGVRDLSQ
jgi:1-acyl-sn-glycerol-3-phosphate acyltransferase